MDRNEKLEIIITIVGALTCLTVGLLSVFLAYGSVHG